VAVICCANCCYLRHRAGERTRYGHAAAACPNCQARMYWTDWLDPRCFTHLRARLGRAGWSDGLALQPPGAGAVRPIDRDEGSQRVDA